MPRLLYIESSPRKKDSSSILIANEFIAKLRKADPNIQIDTLDLWEEDLPIFNDHTIDAKYAHLSGVSPSVQGVEAWEKIKKMTARFHAADHYLFSIPMWNFSVPYILKHYLDNIIQPGLTFQFSPDSGYKGLVKAKSTTVIYARGGTYSSPEMEDLDFQKKYIDLVLGFIGLTTVLDDHHHILSIPREVVRNLLLDQVEQVGIKVHFQHESVKIDPLKGIATILSAGSVKNIKADLIVGCDGSNSIVRNEMSKRASGTMYISQMPASHGYVELNIPMTPDGRYTLIENEKSTSHKESKTHGLHVWPRNNFILLAQPNIDKTYTTSLFMPMESDDKSQPSFEHLNTEEDVKALFNTYFPDAKQHIPALCKDFFKYKPSRLRTIKCTPYHFGKSILFGDSAHTMVPFYGQGVNCGFEDVGQFFKLLDSHVTTDFETILPNILEEYSKKRHHSCNAINNLSELNLQELAKNIGDKDILMRRQLENELHRRHPKKFAALYCSVAFTDIPYEIVVERYKKHSQLLDIICQSYDIETQMESIIEDYIENYENNINLPLEDSRTLIDASIDHLFDYFKELEDGKYPVSYVHDSDNPSKYLEGLKVAENLREYYPPEKGSDFREVLDEIFSTVVKNGTVHTHPGFMAHIPSGGLFQSAVGEFITRSLNRYVGVWIASPGFVQVESNVIHWFCNIIGYDTKAFGYLTTSGSLSNFMGLLCAKENQISNSSIDKVRVYTSSQSHFCIKKAAKMAGLTMDQVQSVNVDENLSMDINHLITLINEDKKRGFTPLCVVATAGTTNTGSVDDIKAIHDYCRQHNIWLHLDACLGGFFAITERGKKLLNGMELADSVSVDAHKSLFLPHGTAALLIKDKQKLRNTFEIPNSSYMPGFSQKEEMVDFCNYGPELSRETRGLSVWLPMKMHGIKGFEKKLDEMLDLAVKLTERLKSIKQLEVIELNTCLPIVIFRMKQLDMENEDILNRRLCKLVCSRGNAYITTTELPHIGVVNRVCILHSKTDETIIEQCVKDIRISVNLLKQKESNAMVMK